MSDLMMMKIGTAPRVSGETNTYALDFERTTERDYLNITDAEQTGLDFTIDYTFMAWGKIENDPGNNMDMPILSKMGGATNRSFWWEWTDDTGTNYMNLSKYDSADTLESVRIAQTLTAGTWYHLAVTVKDSTKTIEHWVNGASIGSGTYTNAGTKNSSADFEIGGMGGLYPHTADEGHWDGVLDAVRVWSRVLAGSEITDFYNNPKTAADGASLQGKWLFNDGSGNPTDSSGNGNTLTNNGATWVSTGLPY